jgi:hypothetical protein
MIMILLRRNLNDIIDNEIDNFRRMLAKLKKMGLVSKRALLIFKIISQLPKYDYSLKLLVFHFKPELELLDNNIIDYGWYVKGYELIRIEKEIII